MLGIDHETLRISITVHIQCKDEGNAKLDQLKGYIEIPLQMCGIHDVDDYIRFSFRR